MSRLALARILDIDGLRDVSLPALLRDHRPQNQHLHGKGRRFHGDLGALQFRDHSNTGGLGKVHGGTYSRSFLEHQDLVPDRVCTRDRLPSDHRHWLGALGIRGQELLGLFEVESLADATIFLRVFRHSIQLRGERHTKLVRDGSRESGVHRSTGKWWRGRGCRAGRAGAW